MAEDARFQITSEHRSSASGVYHIYYQQLMDEVPVRGTESSLHISSSGTVLAVSNRFVPITSENLVSLSTSVMAPKSAIEAIARQLGYAITGPVRIVETEEKNTNEIWLSPGGISARNIKAQLVYAENTDHTYDLAWEIDILQPDYQHWWVLQVNAEDGTILRKEDRMQTCYSHDHGEVLDYNKNLFNIENYSASPATPSVSCTECYEVFAFPLESPYFGERTIEENPADPLASPFGWHDVDGFVGAEYLVTKGNNTNTFEANDNFGYQPEGGLTLSFTGYPFDQEYSQNFQYEDASITNLFYWTNIIHDITYQYGFDEVSGNFQVNNYNRGGLHGDAITAHGQSIDRPCNGSFSTPPDGESPLLIMNLCHNKDGNFDASVIAHEWGHGLSARLTGGGQVENCLRHIENPMEGWSDWLAAILTIKPDDTGATPRTIATYLLGQGPNGSGVRFYPYSTNMEVNPQTYEDVRDMAGVHRIGAIWGEIIWEMTWELINEYGYDPDIYNFTGNVNQDAGNIMAMAIVAEGLKFTPCSPGFVDAREGIIDAAQQIYGSRILCVIWRAFAKRGLGAFAVQGSSENQFDQVPSFETPFDEASFPVDFDPFCLEAGIYEFMTGGFPRGGIYSGPGVIDNGDGESFHFDPVVAGSGNHTILYSLPKTSCSTVSNAFKNILVIEDTIPPLLECLNDVSINQPIGEPYVLHDFTGNIGVSDNCPGDLEIIQTPPAGKLISTENNEIIITARDGAGNESSCIFQFRIFFISEIQILKGFLTFYPNPASNEITLFNPLEKRIDVIEIRDIMGRLVNEFSINNKEKENRIPVEFLSSGTYFVTIQIPNERTVIRLLKN